MGSYRITEAAKEDYGVSTVMGLANLVKPKPTTILIRYLNALNKLLKILCYTSLWIISVPDTDVAFVVWTAFSTASWIIQ
jgi:hypothetical protein